MTSTGFGWIKYEGKIYQHDIMITVSGQVVPRNETELRRKYGTAHAIDPDEIKFLLKEQPEVIVVGTGQEGMAKLTNEAKNVIMQSSVRVIEGPIPAACKKFDELKGKKAALFHVTC